VITVVMNDNDHCGSPKKQQYVFSVMSTCDKHTQSSTKSQRTKILVLKLYVNSGFSR